MSEKKNKQGEIINTGTDIQKNADELDRIISEELRNRDELECLKKE